MNDSYSLIKHLTRFRIVMTLGDNTLDTTLWGQSPLWESYSHSVIFSAFYGTLQSVIMCIEAHTLSLQDNFNIILHLFLGLQSSIFLSNYLTKFCMYFSSLPCLLPILTLSFSFTWSSYQYLMNIKMYVI